MGEGWETFPFKSVVIFSPITHLGGLASTKLVLFLGNQGGTIICESWKHSQRKFSQNLSHQN